jgi:glycerate kinase
VPAAARIAIVEMAAVNGLALVPPEQRDVWHASSYGTGELLLAARARGAGAVLLGVGGSATSDLGLGALCALGFVLEDGAGHPVFPPVPALWPRVARITGGALAGLPELRVACDVDNPLLGPNGAAAVYGPQKGLRASDVAALDAEARRMVALMRARLGFAAGLENSAGAGAAGGIAFGLMAALGARLVPGFALVADWLELDRRIERASWIITGEGRFDASSLAGKGPGAIASRARRAGRRCAIFAGAVDQRLQGTPGAAEQAWEVVAVSPSGLSLEQALAESEQHLSRAIEHWLRSLP